MKVESFFTTSHYRTSLTQSDFRVPISEGVVCICCPKALNFQLQADQLEISSSKNDDHRLCVGVRRGNIRRTGMAYATLENLSLISGQIQELVDYVTRSSPEDERAAVLRSFRDIVKTDEGAKPIEKDEERRRNAMTFVMDLTKSLGDGSEQGASGEPKHMIEF
jgi:hypothetical protein